MSILNKIKSKLGHYTWELAYLEYNQDVIKNGIDWRIVHFGKNPYKEKGFADPFILDNSETRLTLLVEEFDKKIKRGRIAQIVIDKSKDIIISCDIVLDLPTHLSFPVIYNLDDKIIVHPENSESGASYMYEYDPTLIRLVNPREIIREPLTDAIIVKNQNKYLMYSTCPPEPNGSILRTYASDNFLGPYKYIGYTHYVISKARMAGKFLNVSNKIIRPAQNCEGGYGKSVIFYDGLDKIGEICAPNWKFSGIHTFNVKGGICVVDLKKNDFPLLVLLKNFITSLYNKF